MTGRALVWVRGVYTTTDDDNGPMEGIPVKLKAWRAGPYTIIRQRSADGRFILKGRGCGGLVVPTLDDAMAAAEADFASRPLELAPAALEADRKFWIIVHDPGCVPDLKGPFRVAIQAAVIREFMQGRPTSLLTILTVDEWGRPSVEHGPMVLQMIDARSITSARKHNERVHEAFAAPPRPRSPDAGEAR